MGSLPHEHIPAAGAGADRSSAPSPVRPRSPSGLPRTNRSGVLPVDRIKDRDLGLIEPGGPAVFEAYRDRGVGADAPHDLREREPAAGVVEREVAVGDGAFFGV